MMNRARAPADIEVISSANSFGNEVLCDPRRFRQAVFV
ncbi:MAG: hypothetical protein ACI9MU_002558 [Alphaproteobacteria bacterium]|jgi:hypothetical protein